MSNWMWLHFALFVKSKTRHFSPNKDFSQGRGSYFSCIVIPLDSRIAGRQVPKPRCLSPAANSLYSRIAGRQVPKPRCLSPAANSLDSRIAGRQVPEPKCLSPFANSLYSRTAGLQAPKPTKPSWQQLVFQDCWSSGA